VRVLSPNYRGTRCSAECKGSKLARPAGRILGAPGVTRCNRQSNGYPASRTYDAIRPAEAKQVALRSARVPFGATRAQAASARQGFTML